MIRRVGKGPRPWRVRARDQFGKDVQESFRTEADAKAFERDLADKRARARAGLPVEQGPITFGELAEKWKANYPPSTWRSTMLRHSADRWGDTLVRLIEPEAVGAWLHALAFSPKTKTHILDSMRQVLNAGVEWGYLARSPARPGVFRAPGEERLTPIKPFESWDEVLAVSKHLSLVESALVRFVCSTGIRTPGEWVTLTWGDIDIPGRTAIIHGTKTEAAERTIPLSRHALAALADLPRGLRAGQRVFPGRTGGRFDYENWRKTHWRDALDAAGLEHRTPYEMRHTFATLALQAGASIDAVSKVMGHKDITMTLKYYRKWTRPMLDGFRDVLDTIDSTEEQDAGQHQG